VLVVGRLRHRRRLLGVLLGQLLPRLLLALGALVARQGRRALLELLAELLGVVPILPLAGRHALRAEAVLLLLGLRPPHRLHDLLDRRVLPVGPGRPDPQHDRHPPAEHHPELAQHLGHSCVGTYGSEPAGPPGRAADYTRTRTAAEPKSDISIQVSVLPG